MSVWFDAFSYTSTDPVRLHVPVPRSAVYRMRVPDPVSKLLLILLQISEGLGTNGTRLLPCPCDVSGAGHCCSRSSSPHGTTLQLALHLMLMQAHAAHRRLTTRVLP